MLSRDGKYLVTQRRPTATLPLLWEFPGGRVEEGETDNQALQREVRYRIGVDVLPGKLVSFVSHPYDRYIVELYLYECTLKEGEPRAENVNAFRWVTSKEFDELPFTPADEASMNKLLGE